MDDYERAVDCAAVMSSKAVVAVRESDPIGEAAVEAARTFVDRTLYEGRKIGKDEAIVSHDLKAAIGRYIQPGNKVNSEQLNAGFSRCKREI